MQYALLEHQSFNIQYDENKLAIRFSTALTGKRQYEQRQKGGHADEPYTRNGQYRWSRPR